MVHVAAWSVECVDTSDIWVNVFVKKNVCT